MPRRFIASLVVVLVVAAGTAACGGSNNGSSGRASTTVAPEELRVTPVRVALGLHRIDRLGHEVTTAVAAGRLARAKGLLARIEPTWQSIEGTVKAEDADAYLAFEDAFAALGLAVGDGDAARAQKASTAISDAATAYLQAHPA